MKIKTSELKDQALDWAVAKCLGVINNAPSRCCDCRHFEERAIQDGAELRCWLGDLCWKSSGWSEDPFGDEISEYHGVHQKCPLRLGTKTEAYSTDPAQAYPIIDRERISLRDESYTKSGGWYAVILGEDYRYKHVPFKTVQGWDGNGETPLIAAMRCYVASRLGDEVDVPEELCGRGK